MGSCTQAQVVTTPPGPTSTISSSAFPVCDVDDLVERLPGLRVVFHRRHQDPAVFGLAADEVPVAQLGEEAPQDGPEGAQVVVFQDVECREHRLRVGIAHGRILAG
jgi:hypothetical protein